MRTKGAALRAAPFVNKTNGSVLSSRYADGFFSQPANPTLDAAADESYTPGIEAVREAAEGTVPILAVPWNESEESS